MRIKKFAISTCALVCAAVLYSVVANAADVHAGTWKMNPGKSSFSPGPAPKSINMKIETDGNSYKFHSEVVDAAGKATTNEFTLVADGKDNPAAGLADGAETVSWERVDGNTMRSKTKKAGKVVMTVTAVVSADGKTRTVTFEGWDAEGKVIKNVVVYDKQ